MVYGTEPCAPHYKKWNMRGGKVEERDGWEPRRCAAREVWEESHEAIRIHPGELYELGTVSFRRIGSYTVWHVHVYIADRFEQMKPLRGKDVRWVPQDKVLSMDILPGDKHLFQYVLAEKRNDALMIRDASGHVEWYLGALQERWPA